MQLLTRSLAMLAGGAALSAAHAGSAPNRLQIVIANGPLAGTYSAPPSEVICLHAKQQKVYSAAWKDFRAPKAKAMAEAGIEVSQPDAPGAKHGDVRISFGDADHNPVVYQVFQQPLTVSIKGKNGKIAFDGKTKDGIRLQVTATCTEVEEL
jgi:hypothetical protein